MAHCLAGNFAVDCGEGSGCGVVVVTEDEAVTKAIFVCSASGDPQVGVFSPIGSLELETEGSPTVVFACSEIELESLAEALNRIHPESISVAHDKEEERGERITREHVTGTLNEVIDELGLERA